MTSRAPLPRRWAITIEAVIVLLAAGAIAVIITWPVALNFSTDVVGGSGIPSDTMGYWWDIWNNHRNGLDIWGAAMHDQIGYPFGRPLVGSGNLLLFAFTGPALLIATFASATATANTMVLIGFALTGASMYLLIRWLRFGIGVAAWAGIVLMLSPYVMFRSTAHVPLANLWWAPLLLMAGIAWVMRPTWWRALLLAGATLLGWLTNPYFGAMSSAMAGVILLVGLVVFIRRRGGARAVLTQWGIAVGWVVLLVGIPIGLMLRASSGVTEAVTRQRIELDLYGARGWDYLIPPPGTWFSSALVGPGGIDPGRSPGGERIVFIGWLVLALAIAGIALAIIGWRRLRSAERITLAIGLPTIAVALLLSLASPTKLWGLEIAAPSSYIFDYLPYLRAYARFGAVVLVAATVIAALGLSLIIRNRSQLWRYCWISGAIIFSAVEMPISMPLGSGPPLLVDGKTPGEIPVWQWLRDHRQGEAVLETPAFPREDTDRIYMGGQTVHLHPLANGGLNEKNYAADFTEEFANPFSRTSPAAYATAGIPLVVAQPWAWAMHGLTAPDPTKPPAGLEVVKTFEDGSAIWQVIAQPVVAVTFPDRTTWDPPRVINGVKWRYMRNNAVMRAFAPKATTVRITLQAAGYNPKLTYPLTITAPDSKAFRYEVRGRRVISFVTDLPKGGSIFTLAVARPADGSVSDGQMTVQMSQWSVRPSR